MTQGEEERGTTSPVAPGLAAIHGRALVPAWPESAFATLLAQPGVWVEGQDEGFVLMRLAADEAEVLTLAVVPEARRRGLAFRLMTQALERALALGAGQVFLEVAEDNAAARALYGRLGFVETGRRARYYNREGGVAADALILTFKPAETLP